MIAFVHFCSYYGSNVSRLMRNTCHRFDYFLFQNNFIMVLRDNEHVLTHPSLPFTLRTVYIYDMIFLTF